MSPHWDLGLREVVFHDVFTWYAVSRGPWKEGLDPWWASSVLRRELERSPFLRERLASWYRSQNITLGTLDERQLLALLVKDVESGRVRVRELEQRDGPASSPKYSGPIRQTRPAAAELEPPEPIVDEDRLLRIVDCPSVFDPRREPLRIAYLLRDLAGRPVELVIRSEANPEPPVHRRALTPAQTADGSGKLEWDGLDDNTGELVERTAAPFVVELIHDATYRDKASTTLPPPPRAHVLELEDLVFCTDREILLPQSLGALIVLVEFAREHPEKHILVAGHTDTKGSEAHNVALSERRAENVHLWLSGDVDGWVAHCQENFEIADFKAVHLWAHEHLGWATDPGELDNDWHTKARVARDVFRSQCEALLDIELEHHVAQNPADWRTIHDLYSLIVARYLDLEPDGLLELRRSFVFTEPPLLACGEAFPRERAGEDGVASATNRRVEVLFFDQDEEPDLSAEPTGIKIYGEKQYSFEELHPHHLDPLTPTIFEIDIRLVDHWHRNPLSNIPYTLSGPLPERLFQRQGTTDDDGVLHEDVLPSGYYELRTGDSTLIVMAHPVGFSDPNHPQIGPDFRDVYRVGRHNVAPVFPALPGDAAANEWMVPAYIPGPDNEVVVADDD